MPTFGLKCKFLLNIQNYWSIILSFRTKCTSILRISARNMYFPGLTSTQKHSVLYSMYLLITRQQLFLSENCTSWTSDILIWKHFRKHFRKFVTTDVNSKTKLNLKPRHQNIYRTFLSLQYTYYSRRKVIELCPVK